MAARGHTRNKQKAENARRRTNILTNKKKKKEPGRERERRGGRERERERVGERGMFLANQIRRRFPSSTITLTGANVFRFVIGVN